MELEDIVNTEMKPHPRFSLKKCSRLCYNSIIISTIIYSHPFEYPIDNNGSSQSNLTKAIRDQKNSKILIREFGG